MNSFLDLHTSADYRNTNRQYYKSTWECVNVTSAYMIPFQYSTSVSDVDYAISVFDTDDNETDITTNFQGAELITGWTETTTGTWTITGAQIAASNALTGDYVTSNQFTLTKNKRIKITVDTTKFSNLGDWTLSIKKGSDILEQEADWTTWDGTFHYVAAATGSDYTITIGVADDGRTVTATTPTGQQSLLYNSGNYWWYAGDELTSSALTGIFRLKIVHTSTFYSDWCSADTFTDKTKIKISSSYDYGGIKYVDGYEQWTYKNAVVRRAPTAEIEITGDKLNGEIIEEKKVAAIRYKVTMKCTESEYEALVHAMGGTLEITDATGRVFNAVNIELTDATWYSSNGIVELSFVDSNNINVWTMNNSNL